MPYLLLLIIILLISNFINLDLTTLFKPTEHFTDYINTPHLDQVRYTVEPDSKETVDSNMTGHLNFKSFGVASMSIDKNERKKYNYGQRNREDCKLFN